MLDHAAPGPEYGRLFHWRRSAHSRARSFAHKRATIALLAVTIILTPIAHAAPADLDALEARAFAEEAAGREAAAIAAFADVITAAAPLAASDPLAAARAEVALARLFQNGGSTSAPVLEAALVKLGEALQDGDAPRAGLAMVEATRRRYLGHILAASGKIEEVRQTTDWLGYAPSFFVIGPCENKRGTGWSDDKIAADLDLAREHPGKERPVTWRRLSRLTSSGYVDFDAIMTPADEAMAYALTYLHADASGLKALRSSSDEGLKIWVNGRLVLARDVRRPARFDQDHTAVELEAGWNAVMVKVTEGEGEWRMALRITELDGSPAQGVRWLQGEEPAPETATPWTIGEARPSEAEAKVNTGAIGALSAADGDDAPAWIARDLGIMLAQQHAFDRATFPHRDALTRAVARDPKDGSASYHLAEASQIFAEREADKEENAYRTALEATLEVNPESVQALIALARYYRESLDIKSQARELLERALAVNPESIAVQLELAGVLGARGWDIEEQRRIEDLARRYPEDERVMRRIAGHRSSIGDRAGAARIYAQIAERAALDLWIADRLIEHHRRIFADDRALAILAERREIDPFDVDAYLQAAEILAAGDDLAGARSMLDALLALAPESTEALFARAVINRREQKDEAAIADLQALLAVTPGDVAAKDYMDFLSPEAPEYEERFLLDTTATMEDARTREHSTEEGLVTVLQHQITRVHPDGTATRHMQLVRKVTSTQGVQEVGRGMWLPGQGQIEIKVARVVSSAGVERQCKHQGRRIVPPPPVEIGDVFEVRYRLQETEPSDIFDDYFGDTLYFGDFERIENLTYVIVAPKDFTLHFAGEEGTPDPVTETDDEAGLVITRFAAADLPRTEREPLMPPPEEIFPDVQVSSYADWDEFAKWWWGMIHKQYVVSDEMRAELENLTGNLATIEEKVAAIYHFVTGKIRYVAWEFGVHGYKPYEASTIFNRRFGDCKDKAILMNTFFEALGLDARPVLIKLVQGFENRGVEDLRLPTLSHFNHCISRIVLPSGDEIYLDGTARNYGFDSAPPEYDRGATVLVVGKEGGAIEQIPYFDAEHSLTSETVALRLDATGSGAFRHKLAVPAAGEEQWRATLELGEMRVRNMERYYASKIAGTSVDVVRTSDLADLSAEVWVDAEGRAPAIAEKRGGNLVTRAGLFRTTVRGTNIEDIVSLDRRLYDLILGPPDSSEVVVTYELPPGYRLLEPLAPVALDNEFLSYRMEVGEEEGRVTVLTSFKKKAHRVPVARYDEVRELCIAAANAEKRNLIFTMESR